MKASANKAKLITATAMSLLAGGTALASQSEHTALSNCVLYGTPEQMCEIKDDQGTTLLRARKANITTSDGFEFKITDRVYIPTPGLPVFDGQGLPVTGADFLIGFDPATYGLNRFQGDAVISAPDLSLVVPTSALTSLPGFDLAGASNGKFEVSFGYTQGKHLADLGAHLNDEQNYVYFTGSTAPLPINEGLDMIGEAVDFSGSVKVTTGAETSITMVLDSADPYFYTGFTPISAEPGVSIVDNVGGDNGKDWGVGVSAQSKIPFKPQVPLVMGGESVEFNAPLVIDGVIPIPPLAMELDGSLFVGANFAENHDESVKQVLSALGGNMASLPSGVNLGANGNIALGLPMSKNVGLSLDLGNASLGIKTNADPYTTQIDTQVFVSGKVGTDQWTVFGGIPLTPAQSSLEVSALFNLHGDANGLAVGDDSHLAVRGSYELSYEAIQKLIGLDLGNQLTVLGEMKIDAAGFELTGTMERKPNIPFVAFDNAIDVQMYVPAHDPQNFRLRLSGDMHVSVGGLSIATFGEIEISASGLFLKMGYQTPVTNIDMSGNISSSGIMLRGKAGMVIPTAQVTAEVRKAAAELEKAQAEVRRLDGEISKMRAIVQAERDRDAQRLRDAQTAVYNAQQRVYSLDNDIRAQQAAINAQKSAIAAKKRWAENCAWYESAWCWGVYATEAAWRGAKIVYHGTVIAGLNVARWTAVGVLELARRSLQGMELAAKTFPLDADPRVAALFAARDTALGALRLAQTAMANVPQIGDIRGDVDLMISNIGLSGKVTGNYCTSSSCSPFLGGRVVATSAPQACVTLPVIGEQCARI